MVQIIIDDNQTKIKTNDIEIHIEGSFQIKKEGAELTGELKKETSVAGTTDITVMLDGQKISNCL